MKPPSLDFDRQKVGTVENDWMMGIRIALKTVEEQQANERGKPRKSLPSVFRPRAYSR
jgi:hypothetical protein